MRCARHIALSAACQADIGRFGPPQSPAAASTFTTGVVVGMFAVGLMVLGASAAFGQDYPTKPIRILTGAPGAGSDFAARQIAQGLTTSLGQQVIVDNRAIIADIVAQAPPDGYSLLLDGASLWIAPFLEARPYDVIRDFAPISSVVTSPNVLALHPAVAANSVKELIALAKAKPGALNYSSSGAGGSTHLPAALFTSMAGVNIVRIPYKGGGAAVVALLAGETQLMFAGAGVVTPHIKSGKLKGLAVTSAEPSALIPWLPTVAASGLPGYEATQIFGMFAPAKTPTVRVNRLSQEIVRLLRQADMKERLAKFEMEPTGSAPEQFGALVKSDMAKWGKLIKDAGIRAD